MIIIQKPKLIQINGKSRLIADLDIGGQQQSIWYEVPAEYEKYLCCERSDAFLVGVVAYAMYRKHDIKCVAPVTEELLYNLNQHLIPSICKSNPARRPYRPQIFAKAASKEIANCGGVGTGLSCGVDSFHSVLNHWNTPPGQAGPRLTHLLINSVGSFDIQGYKDYGKDKIKTETYERARKVAAELNLPLIETDSNIYNVIGSFHLPFFTAFAVMAMKKLWGVYLQGSDYDYANFDMEGKEEQYDLLNMTCFSTRALRFYVEGGAVDRAQKTVAIADFPLVHKHLHVCWKSAKNCGVCSKCRRTMLTLDLLGKLDRFENVFPIVNYKNNIDEYLIWFATNIVEKQDELYCLPMLPLMRNGKYSDKFEKLVKGLESKKTKPDEVKFPAKKLKLYSKPSKELVIIAPKSKHEFKPPLKSEIEKYELKTSPYKNVERRDFNHTRRYTEKNGKFVFDRSTGISGIAQVMCVGDLMGEPKMQAAAFYEDSFDFRSNFEYVKELFEASDLTIGNLETTICTSAPYALEQHVISDFHCNSPIEYLDALRYAGFDIFSVANNHNLDCGLSGIMETLYHLKKYGFGATGLFLSKKEKRHLLIQVNGIKIGFLSYTTFFNTGAAKLTREGEDIFLNKFSEEKLSRDIQNAKKDGAEFILIYMHWGWDTNYTNQSGSRQKKYADLVANAGADYIVGVHPHALQEYDIILTADGRHVPVAYSLGNFMTSDYNKITRDNIILAFTLKRDKNIVKIIDEHYISCHIFDRHMHPYQVVPSNREIFPEVTKRVSDVIGSKIKLQP